MYNIDCRHYIKKMYHKHCMSNRRITHTHYYKQIYQRYNYYNLCIYIIMCMYNLYKLDLMYVIIYLIIQIHIIYSRMSDKVNVIIVKFPFN